MAKLVAKLLDPELGSRLRALLAVVLGLVTAVIAVLQGVLDVLDVLPRWQGVGSVAMIVQGAITFLGRFTRIGNAR